MQKLAGYSQIQSTGARVASATITVYQTGTLTPATIYADNLATPLSNPFVSDTNGLWAFYAANGHYDVQMSGGSPTISPAYTLSDFLINDGIPTLTLKQGSATGTYTTSSTTFVNVDGTNLSYTVLVPNGSKLLINAVGSFGNLVSPSGGRTAIAIDGVVAQQAQLFPVGAGSDIALSFALSWILNGDGNSHTITLQYLTFVSTNAAVIENSVQLGALLVPSMTFLLTASN